MPSLSTLTRCLLFQLAERSLFPRPYPALDGLDRVGFQHFGWVSQVQAAVLSIGRVLGVKLWGGSASRMPEPALSHQAWLSAFPHLTYGEFENAINRLAQRNHRLNQKHNEWISTDVVTANGITYLSIAKPLLSGRVPMSKYDETDDEVDEDDDLEALRCPMQSRPTSHYDIILSPTYRVPVLYISISDMQQRYPPTMKTLTEHLVPPQFQAETERVGIMGGITITVSPSLSGTR